MEEFKKVVCVMKKINLNVFYEVMFILDVGIG